MIGDKTLAIARLDTRDADFDAALNALTAWESVADTALEASVREILNRVKQSGDAALLDYTRQFDKSPAQTMNDLVVEPKKIQQAYEHLSSDLRQALTFAAERITGFHEKQKQDSWQYTDVTGTVLGQQVTPLDSVGIYVPGGKAAYPSSVLMNALPAKVAGVQNIVMVSPAPEGVMNAAVLAAAHLAGVSQVYCVGGAQAIGALAYGTESVPRVDKIVGPGNRYVACAKKMVFGQVGLDMVAGPSEILIICDGDTDPDWIAMDMFSQAEHDEDAQAILIAPDSAFLDAVESSIARLLEDMPRKTIIRQAIERRSALIRVADLAEAVALSNRIAPEHLELSVEKPEQWLPSIRHAGAIFLGRHTPEAFGDYCAGPNHVLPTSTTARFASPLGVYDFQKRSSVIGCTPESAGVLAAPAAKLADAESLSAHARSARLRQSQ